MTSGFIVKNFVLISQGHFGNKVKKCPQLSWNIPIFVISLWNFAVLFWGQRPAAGLECPLSYNGLGCKHVPRPMVGPNLPLLSAPGSFWSNSCFSICIVSEVSSPAKHHATNLNVFGPIPKSSVASLKGIGNWGLSRHLHMHRGLSAGMLVPFGWWGREGGKGDSVEVCGARAATRAEMASPDDAEIPSISLKEERGARLPEGKFYSVAEP